MTSASLPSEWSSGFPSTNQCIHHLIATQARQSPAAPAILAPERPALSYHRLWTQIVDAVRALNAMGIGRGHRIAMVLPNGPEMAVAFLAVAAGATAAPLNPACQASEFGFYLSDLNARALIVQAGTDSPAIAAACACGIPIVELRPIAGSEAGLFSLTGSAGAAVLPGLAEPHDVALVLHTSGTTARPKIVPLTQANLCASTANIQAALQLERSDRCLNVMPLFHIHGLAAALLSSLAAGSSVVCTPGFQAPSFFAWLERFRPTWYTAVPTMHQAILTRALEEQEAIRRCPLRFIRSCSSALPPQVMAGLEEALRVPVVESYGMTEAAHQIASNPLPPGRRKPGSVGVVAGPEVAIMDEAGHLLAAGATGEIAIRGANVMHGYDSNPEAKRHAFTAGWFRTGDQGYLDGDGYLFITGRLKEIINRGGEKMSPREIDEVLLDHPAVAQAVAFAIPHPRLGEDVAAAVVLRGGAEATGQEIRRFAATRLTYLKVPRQVIVLDEIPKGPTGKVQRIGLAEKLGLTTGDGSLPPVTTEYAPPRNSIEEFLANLWGQVLGIERVGVHDEFAELGGDSIQATQILARLRAAANVDVSLAQFFEASTVAGLARIIERILLKEAGAAEADGDKVSPSTEQTILGRPDGKGTC